MDIEYIANTHTDNAYRIFKILYPTNSETASLIFVVTQLCVLSTLTTTTAHTFQSDVHANDMNPYFSNVRTQKKQCIITAWIVCTLKEAILRMQATNKQQSSS